jgi:hypothetical protein
MSETTIGLIGEYLAAAAILGLGWRVSMAQQDRVDLVAWNETHDFIRVQAKTANLLGDKDGRSPRHHFQMGHGCKTKHLPKPSDYDVLCLVSPMPAGACSCRTQSANDLCACPRRVLHLKRRLIAGLKRLTTFWR